MAIGLIVAAGEGSRMVGGVKKQYLALSKRPILGHTLQAFDSCPAIDTIFLVLPDADTDYCRQRILAPLKLGKKTSLVTGGPARQDSVHNGLLAIDDENPGADEAIVVIHDGVRPFVTAEQIEECVAGAESVGACTLGVPAGDTVKRVDASGYVSATLERESVWLVQTPQAFRLGLILRAHRRAAQEGHRTTDDASLVEYLGEPVKVIRGSRYNLKITRREDLEVSGAIQRLRDGTGV